MASLVPATCASFTSRYSLMASAARKELLRPAILASFSSRCLVAALTLTGICRKFRVRAITMAKTETSYGETEATSYFRRAA